MAASASGPLRWDHWTLPSAIPPRFSSSAAGLRCWPHHFDLAVVWFSGRKVPGQDPNDPEYSNEQMNFGFSTGDSGTPEPYFYATAYPAPDGWMENDLPDEMKEKFRLLLESRWEKLMISI